MTFVVAGYDSAGDDRTEDRWLSKNAGEAYTYPSHKSLQYLRASGVKHVRLAVMWERLQPRLRGELRPDEVAHVGTVLRDAEAVGIDVVLDLHNYGRYATVVSGRREVLVLGSPELMAEDLADFWQRLVGSFQGARSLKAVGIMNEPHDLPGGSPPGNRLRSR